jgi:hypothetical protein
MPLCRVIKSVQRSDLLQEAHRRRCAGTNEPARIIRTNGRLAITLVAAHEVSTPCDSCEKRKSITGITQETENLRISEC